MRTLEPGDPGAKIVAARFVERFERDPCVFGEIMLRGIPAPVKTEIERRTALFERLPEQIHAANNYGKGLADSFAAPPLRFDLAGMHFSHAEPRSSLLSW